VRLPKVLFVSDGSVCGIIRGELVAAELCYLGYSAFLTYYQSVTKDMLKMFDVVVPIRPTLPWVRTIHEISRLGHKVIANVDDDFLCIPPENPASQNMGSIVLQYFIQNMRESDLVVTGSEELATRYSAYNKTVCIPNGWAEMDKSNMETVGVAVQTDGSGIPMRPYTIGFAGTPTHSKDFATMQPELEDWLSKNPDVNIVIVGDPQIYIALKVAPSRKIYYPFVAIGLYPWIVRQMDVIFIPLADDKFNRAKSDIKLLDALVAGIPFVASGVQPYYEWCAKYKGGGYIANGTDYGWSFCFDRLRDPVIRKDLVDTAQPFVKEREMKVLVNKWIEVFNSI
jgi:hypothetical protein